MMYSQAMISVRVPDPIQIRNLVTDEPMVIDGSSDPWPMWKYLAMWVLPDSKLGKGFEADSIRVNILTAFKLQLRGEVDLDDEWVKRLYSAVKDPDVGLPAWAAINLMPFTEAIVEAWETRKKK